MDESRNCGNCCYAHNWQGNPVNVSQRTGECRKGPPTVFVGQGQAGQIQATAVFPPVVASLFCHEHRVKMIRPADEVCEENMAGEIIASQ